MGVNVRRGFYELKAETNAEDAGEKRGGRGGDIAELNPVAALFFWEAWERCVRCVLPCRV
jgi:hypothetical protein